VSDVIDGGGKRPGLPRSVGIVAGAVGIAALIIVVVVTQSGPRHSVAPQPPGSSFTAASAAPTATVASAIQPVPVPVTGSAAEWPSAPGACASTALLPQRTLALHYGHVAGSVLIGGASLQVVRLDQPSTTPVAGGPDSSGLVDALVSAPNAAYAQVAPCGATRGGEGTLYRVEAGAAHRLTGSGRGWLVGGEHHAWGVQYPSQINPSGSAPVNAGPTLTPLDGGRAITLATNAYLFADTTTGMVVGVDDPANPDMPPTVEVVDATTGTVVRTFVGGSLKAAQGRDLILQTGSCAAPQTPPLPCALQRRDLVTGQTTGDYPLPVGRSPVSVAIFSPDRNLIAFQLARTIHDVRFATDFPPSDIAILHLDTGRLSIVPNLEFAPKTEVGLAFDATGNSLLAAINNGDHGELLIWQEGMTGPALVTSIPGPLDAPPPLLVTRQ